MIRSGRGQAQRKRHRATGAAARPDIAEKVLQYFRQNSDATVSVEGIARILHEVGRASGRPGQTGKKRAGEDPTEEWTPAAVMATERILSPIASLRAAREINLNSADWFDASPVAFGADRPSISVESRILSAYEEFVQMTPGGSVDPQATKKAIATLRQLAGRKDDPEVVAALCSVAAGSKKEPGGRA